MKKYILIQNDGEIETNSFELIGASTKRDEKGKIGFFGSGLKYSIAYMMRNSIDFRVFSGNQELKFTTTPEKLKEQQFDRICINGKPTSYTVTMGPTWKEDWFVLREIYCNALDEGTCQLIKETDSINSSAGKTRVYIELTEKLVDVVKNWDRYFSDERQPIFVSSKVYTSGLGSTDGCAEFMNCQPVIVYDKTTGVLYRRGINVWEKSSMNYDYEFKHVDINEDRTAKNTGVLSYAFSDMMGQFIDEGWVKSILRTAQDDKPSQEYDAIRWHTPDQRISEKWVRFSKDNMIVVKDIAGRFTEEMQRSKKEIFLVPANFARAIKKSLPQVTIIGMGSVIGESYFDEIDKTPKMDFLLKEVIRSLKEMNYEVHFDISVAQFENDEVLGQADIKEKKIYIAKKTFDMGRREIALTLIEENEHIKSGKEDETRGFQNHLISQWLTSMENQNGLFL